MFSKNSKNNMSYKDITKKIDYQLTCNFFSFDEFFELSFRNKFKIIKLISKVNNIKLKKNDIKSIINQIIELHETKKISKSSNSLLSFFNLSILKVKKTLKRSYYFLKSYLNFIFIFRLDRKKILRV